jgi:uncharacterized ferritin-like protein (DUF455 family)
MEMHEWAERILSAQTMEEKLLDPELLTDFEKKPAIFWQSPSRPIGMEFSRHAREDKLPTFQDHGKEEHRAVCLHRFAGHELLAVEIMAFALLAFPDAPPAFRKGLANTLKEEQGHVRLYSEGMQRLGIQFGDLPQFKHFWKHTPYIRSPSEYVSIMALTFEMANLDFAPLYRDSFKRHGDLESATIMEQIVKDEISHVGFGMHWFQRLEGSSDFDLYKKRLPPILDAKRAKGFVFNEENRKKARVPEDWICQLKAH